MGLQDVNIFVPVQKVAAALLVRLMREQPEISPRPPRSVISHSLHAWLELDSQSAGQPSSAAAVEASVLSEIATVLLSLILALSFQEASQLSS